MKLGAVIVCAGRGRRLDSIDKPILRLRGKPLFYHAVKIFSSLKIIDQVVLVLRPEHFPLASRYIKDKKVILAKGGRRRRDSVCRGLEALDKRITHVFIHDGARCCVSKRLVSRVASALKKSMAVICAVPARDTLKRLSGRIVHVTLRRENMVCVQTPQGFKRELIREAYRKLGKRKVYDDAQAVELLGYKVKVVDGETTNIKVTYPEDIALAKILVSGPTR